jgi:hypothetical protein
MASAIARGPRGVGARSTEPPTCSRHLYGHEPQDDRLCIQRLEIRTALYIRFRLPAPPPECMDKPTTFTSRGVPARGGGRVGHRARVSRPSRSGVAFATRVPRADRACTRLE